MMVELAERKGAHDTYGFLNPMTLNWKVGDNKHREKVIFNRLKKGDKRLYLIPYLSP